ncbi:MAG: hypothetical protein L3J54_09610, partial [Draconibacterium sp.]|nr:hypothetical protein [Draconibacterium sp.]
MRKIIALFILFSFAFSIVNAQEDLTYQQPPKEILELADAPLTPSVRIDDKNKNIVLLYRNKYKSIAELSETELRLAGLRINPVTNIGSRTTYYFNMALMKIGKKEVLKVNGLPTSPRLANFSWSPDQTKMAFTNTVPDGVELWVLDIADASCKKLTEATLNANVGRPFSWFTNGQSFLVRFLPDDKKPLIDKSTAVPTGPRVSVSDGEKAQNRTYQDLLQDKADEFNFEQLVRSTIYKVDLDGNKKLWKETAMYAGMSFSPDGEYVLISTLHKPFSYIVTLSRFPSKTVIFDKNGNEIKVLLESPLEEVRPK